MRIKTILSLITFAAAFIISVTVAAVFSPSKNETIVRFALDETLVKLQYNKATAQNITRFLEQDIQNGHNRTSEIYRFEEDSSLSSPDITKRARAVSDMPTNPPRWMTANCRRMCKWRGSSICARGINMADFLSKCENAENESFETCQLENQYNREII